MADSGRLLAVGILFIGALYLFVVPTNILIPAEQIKTVDDYPFQDNWETNGTLTGNAINSSGILTLSSSGDGEYTSDEVYVGENDTLSFDNVLVNAELKDDNDNVEVRVFGIDENGTVQESETIVVQDGLTQYGLDERIESSNEYEGYFFQIFLESSDNQEPEVSRVTLEYDDNKPLTSNSLAVDLLAWLLILSGIGVLFIG